MSNTRRGPGRLTADKRPWVRATVVLPASQTVAHITGRLESMDHAEVNVGHQRFPRAQLIRLTGHQALR